MEEDNGNGKMEENNNEEHAQRVEEQAEAGHEIEEGGTDAETEGAAGLEETEEASEAEEEAFEAESLTDDELNRIIEELCVSKAEEFRMLGYEHVTGEEIWECVTQGYEKQGVPLMHRIVNDILSLKVTKFMNWMMMQAYRERLL